MSLRSVHILFIIACLGLMGFLAYWSGQRLLRSEDGVSHATMIVAVLGLFGGCAYLGWFIRKTRSLG